MKYQRGIQSTHQHLINKKITDGPIKPTRTGYTNIKTNRSVNVNKKRPDGPIKSPLPVAHNYLNK